MKKAVWLSYDLSLNGDYMGLYKWLDKNEAKECGDGVAFFKFDFSSARGNDAEEKKKLLSSIKTNVKINVGRDRMYAVWERSDGKIKGRFLVGNRKRAPWEGAAGQTSEEDDD